MKPHHGVLRGSGHGFHRDGDPATTHFWDDPSGVHAPDQRELGPGQTAGEGPDLQRALSGRLGHAFLLDNGF